METINEIVLFEAEDKTITLSVPIDNETTWLSANQMAILFDRDKQKTNTHYVSCTFLAFSGKVICNYSAGGQVYGSGKNRRVYPKCS